MKTLILITVLAVLAFAQASVDQIKFPAGAQVAVMGDTTYSPLTMLKIPKPLYLVKESSGVYGIQISATAILGGCTISMINGSANFSCGSLGTTDRSKPGEVQLFGLGLNGDNYISVIAPPAVNLTYRMQPPPDPPSAPGQQTVCDPPDPLTHICACRWKTP